MRACLKRWPVFFYHNLPLSGYMTAWLLGMGVLAGLAFGSPSGVAGLREIEPVGFFAVPALFALTHVMAPRASWGGKPYWVLAGLWAGAVVFGLLAHWDVLGVLTPWLSLARYVFLAAAVVLVMLSGVFSRACFVAKADRGLSSRFTRAVIAVEALLVFLVLVAAFAAVPYRLALAPRYPGARRVYLSRGGEDFRVARMAWSSDSRTLLVNLDDASGKLTEVRRYTLNGTYEVVARGATLSDQPWESDGRGFLFLRRPDRHGPGEIWYSSADGKEQRRRLRADRLGPVYCSPTELQVAFWQDGGAYVAGPDLTGPRRIASSEGVEGWAPDGKSLVLSERVQTTVAGHPARRWRRLVVPATGGRPRALSLDGRQLMASAWLNARERVAYEERRGPLSELAVGVTDVTVIGVYTLDGKPVREQRYRTGWGVGFARPAVAPDGRRVVVPLAEGFPLAGRLFVVDTVTGGVQALPASVFTYDAAWSPDGRMLAFLEWQHQYREEDGATTTTSTTALGLITGL